MGKKEESRLEDRLNELEAMVGKLESGELGIDESIAIYESGMELVKKLQKQLSSLESRIAVASGEGEEPFEQSDE